jgi:hypothetical protein
MVPQHPEDVTSCSILQRYQCKNFSIDVSNLFKPIRFTFTGFKGEV